MACSVRPARRDDYELVARLFSELGVPDPTPTATHFEERMLPRTLIATDDARGVGYVYWLSYGETAHVGHVVVDPEARGRRVGEALLGEVRVQAMTAGCTRAYLNVKQDNSPALRLYERFGFRIVREAWATTCSWVQLGRMDADDAASVFVPKAEDDASVVVALGVEAVRLATVRARGDFIVAARMSSEGRIVGVAAFAPSVPGIYPIRASHVPAAGSLLRALVMHAREDRVVVTVEGDAALYSALVACGARLDFALFRMEMPLG